MGTNFVYTGIRVKNLDISIYFYTELLGMELIHRTKIAETGGEIAVLKSSKGNNILELNFYPENSKFYKSYTAGEELDHLGFEVDNIEKTLETLGKHGIKPILEVKSDTARWIYIQDPNGIWIELYE